MCCTVTAIQKMTNINYEQMKKESIKVSCTVTLVGKLKTIVVLSTSFILLHLHITYNCKLIFTKYNLPKVINFRRAILYIQTT